MISNTKKILIIEDDADMVRVLTVRLQSEGYNVVVAIDGQEGLDQAANQRPDLIITDIVIPKMSGGYVIRQLQSDERTKDIPVVVLSGILEKPDMNQGVKIEGKTYPSLTKPFKTEALIDLIKKLTNPSD